MTKRKPRISTYGIEIDGQEIATETDFMAVRKWQKLADRTGKKLRVIEEVWRLESQTDLVL